MDPESLGDTGLRPCLPRARRDALRRPARAVGVGHRYRAGRARSRRVVADRAFATSSSRIGRRHVHPPRRAEGRSSRVRKDGGVPGAGGPGDRACGRRRGADRSRAGRCRGGANLGFEARTRCDRLANRSSIPAEVVKEFQYGFGRFGWKDPATGPRANAVTRETPNPAASDLGPAASLSDDAFKVERYFPTLVFSLDVPGSEGLNARLIEAIYAERERDGAGVRKSNFPELGGWHSHVKLHKDATFSRLVEYIDAASAMMCRELGYHRSYRLKIGTMWSIVNPPGGLNRAHIHPGCIWSGGLLRPGAKELGSNRVHRSAHPEPDELRQIRPQYQTPAYVLDEGPIRTRGRKNADLPRLAVPQRRSKSIQGRREGRRPDHRELQPVPGQAEIGARGYANRAFGKPIGTEPRRFGSPNPDEEKVQMKRTDGYSAISIVVHWFAAILVVALFFTHEGEPGSAARLVHVSGGAIAGLFLLWRVWHRVLRGTARPPRQAAVFNLAAPARALGIARSRSLSWWFPDICCPGHSGESWSCSASAFRHRWERTRTCTGSWKRCTKSPAISSFRSWPCMSWGPSSTPFSTGAARGFACSSPSMEAGDHGVARQDPAGVGLLSEEAGPPSKAAPAFSRRTTGASTGGGVSSVAHVTSGVR